MAISNIMRAAGAPQGVYPRLLLFTHFAAIIMSLIEASIQKKLQSAYSPHHLAVDNESHMHSVPENSETHFKVVLVSGVFDGVSKVKRHQQVYATLADELQGPVHALALHLYTVQEWDSRQSAPDSPQCQNRH